MPKTKFQSLIFTVIMVFLMVLCMTVYTLSLSGGGLDYNTFLTASYKGNVARICHSVPA